MKLQQIIISILLVSGIVLGSTTFLINLTSNYDQNVDLSSLNKTYDRMNATSNEVNDLATEILDFELDNLVDFIAIPYKLIQIGWKSAKTVFLSWGTVDAMVSDTAKGLSDNGLILPGWFVTIIMGVFIITIVSILIFAFFKWKFDDK